MSLSWSSEYEWSAFIPLAGRKSVGAAMLCFVLNDREIYVKQTIDTRMEQRNLLEACVGFSTSTR